jgi:mono/diheme cytochrome c family protein
MFQAILILLFTLVCFDSDAGGYPTNEVQNLEGKRLYVLNCVRCHNADPTKAGTIGPELYTTPDTVFATKVPEGKYPSGYTPKRRTKIMPKFPHLTNKTDLIYNYIRSFKNDKN